MSNTKKTQKAMTPDEKYFADLKRRGITPTEDLLNRIPDTKELFDDLSKIEGADKKVVEKLREDHHYMPDTVSVEQLTGLLLMQSGANAVKIEIIKTFLGAFIVDKKAELSIKDILACKLNEKYAMDIMMHYYVLSNNDPENTLRIKVYSDQLEWEAMDVLAVHFGNLMGSQVCDNMMGVVKKHIGKLHPDKKFKDIKDPKK